MYKLFTKSINSSKQRRKQHLFCSSSPNIPSNPGSSHDIFNIQKTKAFTCLETTETFCTIPADFIHFVQEMAGRQSTELDHFLNKGTLLYFKIGTDINTYSALLVMITFSRGQPKDNRYEDRTQN